MTRHRDAGFSLIELVTVVAVLAVLSISVVLSTGRGGNTTPRDADLFATTVSDLHRQAVLQGRVLGLDLGVARWQVLGARPDDPHVFAPLAAPVVLRGEGRFLLDGRPLGVDAPDGTVDMFVLPDGRTALIEASFFSGVSGREGIMRCVTDGWGGVACARP